MSAVLAVDPGANGGAALVDGERVLAWWAWTRLERKGGEVWRLRYQVPWASWGAGELNFLNLGDVARTIREQLDLEPALVVEGLFVPRAAQGINIQSHTALAESAGWLMGGLGLGVPVARPLASVWRPAVLGLRPSTPADQAEAFAIKATRWADWPGDPVGRLSLAELGAVAEARLIGRWWLTCGRRAA